MFSEYLRGRYLCESPRLGRFERLSDIRQIGGVTVPHFVGLGKRRLLFIFQIGHDFGLPRFGAASRVENNHQATIILAIS